MVFGAECKHSRPSGSVPPAPKTSPHARTSSEVAQPWTSSSFSSLPLGGQVKKGESRGAPSVAPREGSSPPARPRSIEKDGSVSSCSSGTCECASVSSAPSGVVEGEVAHSQQMPPLPAPLPRLPLPAHRSMLCDAISLESLWRSAPILNPPGFPDLRIEEQGRTTEPALCRTVLVTRGCRSRSHFAYRLWSSSRERRRRSSSRSLSSREWSRSSDCSRSSRVRSHSRVDRSLSSDRYRSR